MRCKPAGVEPGEGRPIQTLGGRFMPPTRSDGSLSYKGLSRIRPTIRPKCGLCHPSSSSANLRVPMNLRSVAGNGIMRAVTSRSTSSTLSAMSE